MASGGFSWVGEGWGEEVLALRKLLISGVLGLGGGGGAGQEPHLGAYVGGGKLYFSQFLLTSLFPLPCPAPDSCSKS